MFWLWMFSGCLVTILVLEIDVCHTICDSSRILRVYSRSLALYHGFLTRLARTMPTIVLKFEYGLIIRKILSPMLCSYQELRLKWPLQGAGLSDGIWRFYAVQTTYPIISSVTRSKGIQNITLAVGVAQWLSVLTANRHRCSTPDVLRQIKTV